MALDEERLDSVHVSRLWFASWSFTEARGSVYRAQLSSLQTWQNLIGVKGNLMFSSQRLVSFFFFSSLPSSQRMTHFSCRGLRNKIILLLYGLNSLICSVQAASRSAPSFQQIELMVTSFRSACARACVCILFSAEVICIWHVKTQTSTRC